MFYDHTQHVTISGYFMVVQGTPIINLHKLAERFPRIIEIARVLEENDIRYGMFCSGTVETFTGYREASDIDLLIDSAHVSRVASLILDARADYQQDRIQISLNGTDYIDFFGQSTYYEKYPFFLTDLVWEHSLSLPIRDTAIHILHPLETILVKAIQQRGIELGKHDHEDAIQLAMANVTYDLTYVSRRLHEIRADRRIFDFLKDIKFASSNTNADQVFEPLPSPEIAYAYAQA